MNNAAHDKWNQMQKRNGNKKKSKAKNERYSY